MRPWTDLREGTKAIRSAAQAAVDAASLRSVAAAVGMSAPGLQHFLDGGRPLRPTLRKLVRWYAAQVRSAGQDSRDRMRAAVALVLTYVPSEARENAGRELMQVLERYASETGMPLAANVRPFTPKEIGE